MLKMVNSMLCILYYDFKKEGRCQNCRKLQVGEVREKARPCIALAPSFHGRCGHCHLRPASQDLQPTQSVALGWQVFSTFNWLLL